MTKGFTRVGTALLAIGLVAGSAACRKEGAEHGVHPADARGVCATPCNQILVVGADGALSCGDANIALGVNEVAWRTASPTAKLQIVFDPPSPFPNLRCQGGICISGPADPTILPPGTNSKSFGYTATSQSLDEASTSEAPGGGQSTAAPAGATPTPTPSVRSALGHIIIQR